MRSSTLLESNHHWDVQEGTASELAPTLKDKRSEVLAFVVHGEDDATVRGKFAVLKQVANMIHVLVEDRNTQRWNALVEALTPDIQFSPNKIIEAQMMGTAKKAILESGDFIKASAIAGAADYSSKNPSSQPNRWKRNGQIFAIQYKGVDLYPKYALDHQDGVRPLPAIAKLLQVLSDKDDWQKAFWFGSMNSYLGERMPKDVLKTDPDRVFEAAEMEAAGVLHG